MLHMGHVLHISKEPHFPPHLTSGKLLECKGHPGVGQVAQQLLQEMYSSQDHQEALTIPLP